MDMSPIEIVPPKILSSVRKWPPARPAIVVVIYLICSSLYIVFSDELLSALAPTPSASRVVSELKGLTFVFLTAVLAYWLLWKAERKARQAEDASGALARAFGTMMDLLPLSVVTVDPLGTITSVNRFGLSHAGYGKSDLLGHSIQDLAVEADKPLIDRAIARGRAGEIVESVIRMKHSDGREVPYRLQAAGLMDDEGRITGFVGAGIDVSEEQKAERRLRESFRGLETTLDQTIAAVSKLMESRDPYLSGHQQRVTELALRTAERMGLDEERRHGLRLASLCHDIGKIHVPAEILSKPGRLTYAEFEIIKTHPQTGFEILSEIDFPWPVAQIVHQHHERMDGSGYPRGLAGDQILLEARIIGVCDVVESMQSHRPYRASLGLPAALTELCRNRGRLYDPAVVDACIGVFEQGGFSFTPEFMAI